ncbi:hypothetical protein Taro_056473 [Colocasia esculenta]|uniref:Glycosyltransferase n=1 Tax=Colocasia esculenta TaxID=4460 RepID=A0A843XU15_COLES|nr:hypothetical protein [Colocasia esculenta]
MAASAPPAAGLVFLPAPGAGHLASTVEMAKRLVGRFSVIVLTMRPLVPDMVGPAASSYIDSLVSSGLDIRISELPLVDFPVDPTNRDGVSIFSNFIQAHRPHVRDAIACLLSSASSPLRIAGIFVDLFSTGMIDVGDELGIPTYVYFTSSAAMLGLMLYQPTLHEEVPSEMADVEGDIRIPSFAVPIPPLFMPGPMLDKKSDGYAWFVRHGRRFRSAKGIVVNSFTELETTAAKALTEGRCLPDHATPPIYLVGPVLSPGSAPPDHECLKWLDRQPPASVVFLCFGSMGSFEKEQLKEIALGLERSGHRFLWSLRTRLKGERFTLPRDADLGEALPEGFLERTAGRGLVWPSWAPQVEVLAHPAVGGFLTHCGWNSTLESVWNGVPTLAWPLYAEQKLNAHQMVRETGVAVDALGLGSRRDQGAGVVEAAEVERGLRWLMGEEGRKARARAAEMKKKSRDAMGEGGSSSLALERLVESLTR